MNNNQGDNRQIIFPERPPRRNNQIPAPLAADYFHTMAQFRTLVTTVNETLRNLNNYADRNTQLEQIQRIFALGTRVAAQAENVRRQAEREQERREDNHMPSRHHHIRRGT